MISENFQRQSCSLPLEEVFWKFSEIFVYHSGFGSDVFRKSLCPLTHFQLCEDLTFFYIENKNWKKKKFYFHIRIRQVIAGGPLYTQLYTSIISSRQLKFHCSYAATIRIVDSCIYFISPLGREPYPTNKILPSHYL